MVDWPTSPVPTNISAPQLIDPELEFQSEQGYRMIRPRFSKGFRRWVVQYRGLKSDSLAVLVDFVRRVTRNRGNTFGWSYPYGYGLTNVTNASPIVLTVTHTHWFQTGDIAAVSGVTGTTAANGAYAMTRVSSTQMSLNGTTGNGTYTGGGVVTYRVNAMRLVASDGALNIPDKEYGPFRGADGLWHWTLTMEEQF